MGRLFGRDRGTHDQNIGRITAFESVDGDGSVRGVEDFVEDDSRAGTSDDDDDDECDNEEESRKPNRHHRSDPNCSQVIPTSATADVQPGQASSVATVAPIKSLRGQPKKSNENDSLNFSLGASPGAAVASSSVRDMQAPSELFFSLGGGEATSSPVRDVQAPSDLNFSSGGTPATQPSVLISAPTLAQQEGDSLSFSLG